MAPGKIALHSNVEEPRSSASCHSRQMLSCARRNDWLSECARVVHHSWSSSVSTPSGRPGVFFVRQSRSTTLSVPWQALEIMETVRGAKPPRQSLGAVGTTLCVFWWTYILSAALAGAYCARHVSRARCSRASKGCTLACCLRSSSALSAASCTQSLHNSPSVRARRRDTRSSNSPCAQLTLRSSQPAGASSACSCRSV